MNENHLSWTISNWITVFLMFVAGWAIIGFGLRFAKSGMQKKAAPAG